VEDIRQCLKATYPGRWTGRRGRIAWTPRWPDLTPVDFFLWGHCSFMQSLSGQSKIPWQDFKQLWQRLMPAC
jgi:hypothetical protein